MGSNHDFDVMLSDGQVIRCWTQIVSLNENRDETAREWVSSCFAPQPNRPPDVVVARYNVLVAIRLDIDVPGYRVTDYLNELTLADAKIESIVTLGERTPADIYAYGVPCADILDVTVPTNWIAHQVRAGIADATGPERSLPFLARK